MDSFTKLELQDGFSGMISYFIHFKNSLKSFVYNKNLALLR